jgi:ferredoxin-thioredoxin reductase catalytic subunit
MEIKQKEIDYLYEKLDKDAESGGYHLNPDTEMTKELVKSLIINTNRYGYQVCPCRIATGVKVEDLDIICPCDYRDPDLEEFDACYCGLYVSTGVISGEKEVKPIPERRPSKEERDAEEKEKEQQGVKNSASLPYPVWRCKVCGYLCARNEPPGTCLICKAKKERFELFL